MPNKEKYNVIDQIERAVVPITNNIAEGFGRQSAREITQFLYIPAGSLKEVQNMLMICRDLEYITSDQDQLLDKKSVVVSKLLYGLIAANKRKI